MNTKDKFTLWVSIAALGLSMYATIATELSSVDERRLALRNELTDTLSKLTTLQLNGLKLERQAQGDAPYLQAVNAVLNQENGFLVDQAAYLADQIPKLTTTYELNTIAAANANAGNFLMAEKYYKQAINIAPTDLYKSMALRSYAIFLFRQDSLKEGRQTFQKAITTLQGDDNYARYQNGITEQMWAIQELAFAHAPEKATEHFDQARKNFSAIDIRAVKSAALKSLEESQRAGTLPQGTPAAALAHR